MLARLIGCMCVLDLNMANLDSLCFTGFLTIRSYTISDKKGVAFSGISQ